MSRELRRKLTFYINVVTLLLAMVNFFKK
ncbi:unnamed protein product [Staphylococcus haemolyticus JCSC1435]|uniref:Uncharacterized protein n=1 Tax=Staphylococcus haemolyticus (strain JCSC1435) TaxID=279808 RepID=Q4L621_STAHJ|nr:unnamed protein product [Staphylococcus haemolyticus JCSC1435]